MWINRLKIMKIFFFGILLFSALIFTIHYAQRDIVTYKPKYYLINTIGCQIPYYGTIPLVGRKFSNVTCHKELLRTGRVGSELHLNLNRDELWLLYKITFPELKYLKCEYSEIKRINDKENNYSTPVPFTLVAHKRIMLRPNIEFARVDCYNAGLKVNYTGYHFFAIDKKANKNKTQSSAHNEERISVMLFGIDNLSHMQFLRLFGKTHALISNLPHTEFWGYNKIGENAYPNLMALLTGKLATELQDGCKQNGTFDKCNFIWSLYQKMNYTTAYAEDDWQLTSFIHAENGFIKQPTDYVLSPIIMEMQKYLSYNRNKNYYLCYGGRRSIDVLFEFIRKMRNFAEQQDFFSLFRTASFTHADLYLGKHLEPNICEMFEDMQTTGVLNKTFIFLVSEHGMSWGKYRTEFLGMLEESQPILLAIYPAWFTNKYPQAIANLASNAHRLTTPFDIYASLQDLANLSSITDIAIAQRETELAKLHLLPRGISVFLPIPERRTCSDAGIAAHWCTCYQRKMLPVFHKLSARAAKYLVQKANKLLKPFPQCAQLKLYEILSCEVAMPQNRFLTQQNQDCATEVTVRIITKPGYATLEATVYVYKQKNQPSVLKGGISRLNLYGNQSYCIDRVDLKLLCYCKTLIFKNK